LRRPIIARLRSESHLNERITPRGSHQRLLQQNLPIVPLTRRSKKRHYSITSSARLRWPPRKHHVRVLPDHGVAFTRNVLERRAVEDPDVTAVVMDEAGFRSSRAAMVTVVRRTPSI
jgi:hypothetical protein